MSVSPILPDLPLINLGNAEYTATKSAFEGENTVIGELQVDIFKDGAPLYNMMLTYTLCYTNCWNGNMHMQIFGLLDAQTVQKRSTNSTT